MLEDILLFDNISINVVQTLLKADMARDTAGGVTLGLKILNVNKGADKHKLNKGAKLNWKLDPTSKVRSRSER